VSVIWTVLAALVLCWLAWALMENGPTLAGISILAVVMVALIDYA
jgi:hypothetical protein